MSAAVAFASEVNVPVTEVILSSSLASPTLTVTPEATLDAARPVTFTALIV
jgi:hypothetical protein